MTQPNRAEPGATQPVTLRGIVNIARYAGLDHHTVRAAVKSGALPVLGLSKQTVVLVEDIHEWLRSTRVGGAA